MALMQKALSIVLSQIRLILFMAGALLCYSGLASFSVGAANIAAGLFLMACATESYFRRTA